jgi:hypothetical protein
MSNNINACIRKREMSKINIMRFHHRKVEKEEQIKPKRGTKEIKIRGGIEGIISRIVENQQKSKDASLKRFIQFVKF